jgi:hypothetical protein
VHYGLISDREINETVPRKETTIACYLRPCVELMPPGFADALEAYVQAASRLYRRGSIIANLIAMSVVVASPPSSSSQQRDGEEEEMLPRFGLGEELAASATLRDFAVPDDPKNSPLKQVFLPERWPTATVQRDARIEAVLRGRHAGRLPSLPDWRYVSGPTGWDNAINRMASKYAGNINVHARAGAHGGVKKYLRRVQLEEGTPRELLLDVILKRLRPLAIGDADFGMCMDIRTALGVPADDPTNYPFPTPPWSPAIFALHAFLVRHGVADRSYLPVAGRNRKYCYVDAKVVRGILGQLKRRQAEEAKKARGGKKTKDTEKSAGVEKPEKPDQEVEEDVEEAAGGNAGEAVEEESQCVGDLLGLDPETFNQRSKTTRRRARRCLRGGRGGRRERGGNSSRRKRVREQQKRQRKMRERARRLGRGRMNARARVDSFETDGVGMRLCVKTPVDYSKFIRPLPATLPTTTTTKTTAGVRGRTGRARRTGVDAVDVKEAAPPASCCSSSACSPSPCSHHHHQPAGGVRVVAVGVDTGRAKLFTAAVSRDPLKKPESLAFTRRQYYASMGYWRHQKWNKERSQGDRMRIALAALAGAGGLGNADEARWAASLDAERAHERVLLEEYLEGAEHALWRMRLFRKKRQALDRATGGLLRLAAQPPPARTACKLGGKGGEKKPEKPVVVVVGIGNGRFAPTGRGEMAVPTTMLGVAFKRAAGRAETPVMLRSIWEHRTTLCCCACGSETSPPLVRAGTERTGRTERRSRRLRLCTSCETTGKRRDRDVQAARNILWLLQHEYWGAERPPYLCRDPVRVRGGADAVAAAAGEAGTASSQSSTLN